MLANFLLMPFFPSSHVVVVFVAVADRTKQGNTPNDDNNVVVLALVFSCLLLRCVFGFSSALRTVFVVCGMCCNLQ